MRGVPVPDREDDFAADPAELFFDLVYVFAFSRLVLQLVHHPDWSGVGEFLLLFGMIWLPWTQFTWSANAVAGNSRPVRLLFLVATVACVLMAGSVTTALDDGGPVFAISLSVILGMALIAMIAGLDDHPGVRASIVRYSIPNWIAIGVMVVGAFLQDGARVIAWVAAIGIIVVGTLRAGADEWLVRPGHFAERHGLILIVALGEVIVALGTPVVESLEDGAGLAGHTIVALVAAGVLAGALWWSWFDRPGPALEHRHEQLVGGHERGRFARDVYTYAHFPMVAGVLLAAAGMENVMLHPTEPIPSAFRWMLAGGLALCLLSVVISIYRAFRALAVERLITAAVLAGLVVVLGELDGIVVLVAVDLVVLAMLVVEHLRIEVRVS